MPSMTADSVYTEEVRAELHSILQSQSFVRSPGLSRLLSYLCEKVLSGESGQIKEYSVALDVFGRHDSFDQDSDSIVRVQANRLRKRLAEYYATEGKEHKLHITIPVGTYVPVLEEHGTVEAAVPHLEVEKPRQAHHYKWRTWVLVVAWMCIVAAAVSTFFILRRSLSKKLDTTVPVAVEPATPKIGLPVGDETRILAGSTRSYVDRSGKLWNPDVYFTGGTVVRSSVQHIWRTQDPAIYRTSRQGDFSYNIPLKPGIYELHLHFAETYYGPEDPGGGGEGSRIMNIAANGKPLVSGLDVVADASGGRTADVRVFSDISPDKDGLLHLAFSSATGRGMVSAIEILPGYPGHMRPVRIVARDVPYYSNDSQWWSSDAYFKGGQFAGSEEPAVGTEDPELYETERWGHFSYAVPVTSGQYRLSLHFVERGTQRSIPATPNVGAPSAEQRIFDVLCNGKLVIRQLNLIDAAGQNHALVRRVSGLQPNAQGKLLLEFVPTSQYATVSAIEVVPE
jgi:hypothetical protein